MGDFLFARSQMAMSLAFHIVFAALGIGLPLLMALAEGMYLRTNQPVYLDLSKRWAKGTAILFAVGAVSARCRPSPPTSSAREMSVPFMG